MEADEKHGTYALLISPQRITTGGVGPEIPSTAVCDPETSGDSGDPGGPGKVGL
jgi:hypothetical protein